MASNEELTLFLAENIDTVDLAMTNFTWPQDLGLSINDVQVSASVFGYRTSGRGTDEDPDKAILKAFSECAERAFALKRHWPQQDGVAAHISPEECIENAISELIERHIFFDFFTEGRKFPPTEKVDNSTLQGICWLELSRLGIDLTTHLLTLGCGRYFCLSVIDGLKSNPEFGVVIGTSVARSKSAAVDKSLTEALRYYTYARDLDFKISVSWSEFKKIRDPILYDHARLGLNREYANWFTTTFLKAGSTHSDLEIPTRFELDLIEPNDTKMPLYICRASNSLMLGLQPHARNKQTGFAHPFL